jgi:hypothetical protein
MRNLRRWCGACVVLAIVVGLAYVGQEAEPSGVRMAAAAEKLLAGLTPEQKAKAAFAFDDKERFNWHFIPLEKDKQPTRRGMRLEEMTPAQKSAMMELLRAGLSAEGYQKATTIMSLESILKELEQGKGPVRNPEWYFVTIYGTPAKTGRWSWRIEGHHLCVNYTLDNSKIISATPAFFGANPAVVKAGPKQGLRTLPEAEDLARALFKSLDDDQRKTALQAKQLPEVKAMNRAPEVGEPIGLLAGKLSDKQREVLVKLLQSYAARVLPEAAEAELKRLNEAGIREIHIAYWGGLEPGEKYTYRLHGPTFVVEFLNVQDDSAKNPANHIHSCWRSLKNDFGLGLN